MNRSELKMKIKDSMLEYLKPFGYPDRLKNEEIIRSHLPGLWKKIEKEGLLETLRKDGLTYRYFVDTAVKKFQEVDLISRMFSGFGGFRF